MTLPRPVGFALCLSLFAPALAAQDKKAPPKADPKKPPVVVSTPGAVSRALRPPLELDTIRFFVQIPEAGGGTRASADGRYVALNRPSIMVGFTNQSASTVILRGTFGARLYRGTPTGTAAPSVSPVERTTTVQQMFDDMRRYTALTYSSRTPLTASIGSGAYDESYGRLANRLDSLPKMEYQRATWSPRTTVILETNTLYTIRVDLAHERDGTTRYYRGELSFRIDSLGRMFDRRITYPPPPAPTTGRPSVEVKR